MIAKKSQLQGIYEELCNAKAVNVNTIPLGQGNKGGRVVGWTFLTEKEQKEWRNGRWNAG